MYSLSVDDIGAQAKLNILASLGELLTHGGGERSVSDELAAKEEMSVEQLGRL